jgi:large subunit ribosomal protein L7/L12
MTDLNELRDQLSTLTVMEATELSRMLEKHWGVSASAPVAVVTTDTSLPAEAVEEQTEFTVVLTSGGDKRINVIKEVRALRTDLGLKEAKDLVETAPQTIRENISKIDAEEIKARLTAAGATVEIR